MSVSVRMGMAVVMPMVVFVRILMRIGKLILMIMFVPMCRLMFMIVPAVIGPTMVVSCHPGHLTLVVPATTYSSLAVRVVAPPHNTAKFEQNGPECRF